jgi:hypothetical protein
MRALDASLALGGSPLGVLGASLTLRDAPKGFRDGPKGFRDAPLPRKVGPDVEIGSPAPTFR